MVVKSSLSRPLAKTRPQVLRGSKAEAAEQAFNTSTLAAFDPLATQRRLTPEEVNELARRQGFQKGYAEGLEAARQEVEAAMDDANKRVRRALAALCEAVDGLDQRETTALHTVEDEIAAGAVTIAHAILQRELDTMSNPGAEAIARAMKLVPPRGDAVARLNPDDVATLSIDQVSTTTRTVRVVADPSIEPGGCVVDVGDSRIDAQLSTALANVTKALEISPTQIPEQAELVRHTGDQLPVRGVESNMASDAAGSSATDSGTTAAEAPIF